MGLKMNVSNGTISEIAPYYASKMKDVFDVKADVQKVISPLFTSLVAGTPITISDVNQSTYTEDDIVNSLINCCSDAVDVDSENIVEGFLKETMRYYSNDGAARELFLNQAATKAGLPLPTAAIRYTARTDVVPACKDFIAGAATEEHLQASIGYTFRAQTLGLYFVNEVAFDQFKADVAAQFAQISQMQTIDPNVISKFTDFQSISLTNSLIETIRIRNDVTDDNGEFSFSRILHSIVMSVIHKTQMSGIIAFDLEQLVCPVFVTFINISKHAHSTPKAIMNAWDELEEFKQIKVQLVSTKKLMKASSIQRIKKASAAAAQVAANNSKRNMCNRSVTFRFSKDRPNAKTMIRSIMKVLEKMKDVAKSENVYKTPYMTFRKANRRRPDDVNMMGKSMINHYHPDIHLYIDTSGSISQENYEAMVKMCIALAQKLNVDMYFNSFSDVLSTATKLHIRDRSKRDVYREFEKVPKVSGGTDYEQIWQYIENSSKRRSEFSLIISDFEWTAPSHPVKHPKNLYYVPCANMDWNRMRRYAKRFGESMLRITPDIRNRILM